MTYRPIANNGPATWTLVISMGDAMRAFSIVALLSAALTLSPGGVRAGKHQNLETIEPAYRYALTNITERAWLLVWRSPPGGILPAHRNARLCLHLRMCVDGGLEVASVRSQKNSTLRWLL
jgi:hypothetical protein